MASSAKRRRQQPYDMDNPVNWTINKLKTELETRGIRLTAAVSKAALVQLYNQLTKTDNDFINTEVSSGQTSQDQSNSLIELSQGQRTQANQTISPPATVALARSTPATVTSALASPVMNASSSNTGPIGTQTNHTGATTSSAINDSSSPSGTHNAVVMTTSQPILDSTLSNSSLGMITAMQNTISSLQATVTQLMTEKVNKCEQPSVNMLEKIYGKETAIPATTTASQFGVPADSLPHVDIISDTLKRNILEGKYINLAALLIADFEPQNVTMNEASGLEFLRQGRRDHRLDRSLSIIQFFKAFGLYKRIMSEAYPQRRLELDLYEADIGNIYEHYGDIFYQYHRQFSKKAAAYLEKGIKIDWSKRDKDLFQLIVGGTKTNLCEHCLQSDHQSPFCPSQYNMQSTVLFPKKQIDQIGKPFDSKLDRKGRNRVTFQGKEICNNFNNYTCKYPPGKCPFAHVCKRCKSDLHGELQCYTQKESSIMSTNPETDQKEKRYKSSA